MRSRLRPTRQAPTRTQLLSARSSGALKRGSLGLGGVSGPSEGGSSVTGADTLEQRDKRHYVKWSGQEGA